MDSKTKPPDLFNQRGALSNRWKSTLTDPKGMHAVLGRITVTVLPKMCQQIIESIISADNLYCSFQNRNDLKIILVEEELAIINTMVSDGYKHFTVQLCYKILRHEQWVGMPRQNWGNVPLHTDIHISDDIERIRLSRNKIVSMETKSLDKATFLTLIDEFREIAKRVDFYLKKDVKFLLQIQPTESAEIESTVEEIRRLPIIEDNPFPVHTINQGKTNYARLGLVVVDILPGILREIMCIKIAPEVLNQHIKKQLKNSPVFDKMAHEERVRLKTLTNRTYDNIDFITLYKLMRSLLLLNDPTQGWGKPPKNTDVTISDDVERLRFARNKIVHRIKADIDMIEMHDYFSDIVHITQRIDTYLCKLPDQGFEREVLNYQTHCIDSEMEQKYYQALKDSEDIKEKFSVENVHFYYGKTFSNFIQDVQDKAKSSERIRISLVLEDINDDEKHRILNELKTEINSGLVNIEFKQAVSGSLVIYIDILDSNLLSTEHELGHQIYNFLCRALQLTGFNIKTENEITVVLIKEEDDIEVEFSIESDNWETYDEEISLRSNSLCLELDVNTEIFNTEQKMRSEFGLLVKSVLGSNGNSNTESVNARLEPGIVAQQSAQVMPVSGTSGVGPTTFKQDQSVKNKPMKSNNDNEGDVSTASQESDESAQQSAQVEPVSGTSWMGPTTFQQDQSVKNKPMKSNNENEGDVSTVPQGSDESEPRSTFNMPQSTKLLVAAIDFGTTHSGYAFSFRRDFENDPCNVSLHIWKAASGEVSLKTPTSILLNPQEEFECFGYDAEDKYAHLANDDLHHEWYYFRRFKMMLHGQLGIKRDVIVKTVDGKKELPALTILSMTIKFLKDHLMTTLDKRDNGVRPDDIQWVLTVPAIWNDPAKQFMREAAQKAGIGENNLIIALEPEVASMFCKSMPVQSRTDPFQAGSKYILLDCGGGTVYITVHQVQEDESLMEPYNASGGVCGGIRVDIAFEQMLINIVGSNIYSSFCDKNTADVVDMFREFELKKKGFSGGANHITIKIPPSLKETFEIETDETIQDVLSQSSYSGKMKFWGDKLRINSNLFETLFNEATNNIIEHLNNLLREPEVKGITNIIMVGGFSESSILQTKVKEGFPDMTVIIPEVAGLSVLKGAVIFGHMPRTISSRKAKYTFGLATMTKFVKGRHREDKKEFIGDQVKCKDIFSVHVEKGQTIEIDVVQKGKCYNPVKADQKEIKFQFYISETNHPMYITDCGCIYIGNMTVSIPNISDGLDRPVKVSIIFCRTELRVTAVDQKTNKATWGKLQFLKSRWC